MGKKTIKGTVLINEAHCKGCGLCVSVCPRGILFLHKEKRNLKGYSPSFCTDPDACIGCGMCAIMCPDSAITVTKE